jgi:eukaryotic translation initiation factor 2C
LDERFRLNLPRNIDLPPEAYIRHLAKSPFAFRPKLATAGKEINVRVNQFRIAPGMSTSNVQQYDVVIVGEDPSKNKGYDNILRKCWNSSVVQEGLKKTGKRWLFDGKKLAWSLAAGKELRFTVDLDVEMGRPSHGGTNTFRVVVKHTTKIHLEVLRQYLQGTYDWDIRVLECMNFLDHAIRQRPSETMIPIKRTFFSHDQEQRPLDLCVAAACGTYASIRLANNVIDKQSGLGINVNTANTTFWNVMTIDNLIRNYLHCTGNPAWKDKSHYEVQDLLQSVPAREKQGEERWLVL